MSDLYDSSRAELARQRAALLASMRAAGVAGSRLHMLAVAEQIVHEESVLLTEESPLSKKSNTPDEEPVEPTQAAEPAVVEEPAVEAEAVEEPTEDARYAGLLAALDDELVILENKLDRTGPHPLPQAADLDQLKLVASTLRAKYGSYPTA